MLLDRRNHRREAARARVLILGELLQASLVLGSVYDKGLSVAMDLLVVLPTTAWQQHGARRATEVTDDVQVELVAVYTELMIARGALAFLIAHPVPTLPAPIHESLGKTIDKINHLRTALGASPVS